ncbi:hypothetical protein ACOMHN_063026 [Nucella lapillus]
MFSGSQSRLYFQVHSQGYVFRFAVKALIDKACFCSIDDGCEEFINFSATIEHILQHRLRPSKAWYLGDDRSHFWFYIKTACHRQDLRGCITNIDNIENIKSPVAKGRAFVRCALMEKRLSEYLGEALKQTHITRRFYKPGAIMLGEEATELCGTLLGLNSIDFGFCVKGENYDTVECPLVISYFPFMKFRQSQESLHSDMEEMRELSCGSSLASEDGQEVQDTPPNDPWPERYNLLHKRYMRVLEQKSFLEEVMASQEKALQAAAGVQQEVGRMQRDAAFQKQQYEGVILELQAQVTRMKSIHEALQQQLMSTRGARYPLVEMDPRRAGEATRFAAAMGHKLESDRQSLTSSLDRGSVGRLATAGGDTRSLASALSEISVDVVGQGQTTPRPPGEDSQSMVPLTGSLGDLHLALEPGTAMSESSMAVNPEQSTPVVSVSSGLYTSTFDEEINGNGGRAEQSDAPLSEATLCKMLSVQVSQSEERDGDHATEDPNPRPQTQDSSLTASAGAATATAAGGGGREAAGNQNRGDAAIPDSGKEREESENVPPESAEKSSPTETPNGGTSLVRSYDVIPGSENVSDRQSEASGSSEPEVLVAEENVSGWASSSSSAGDQDSQEAEVLSHMTSSKESALSDRDDSSEPEVLAQEDENIGGENATADVRQPASASPDREEEEAAASDPEILDEVSSVVGRKEHSDLTPSRESRLQGTAYESRAQGGASSLADVPSSDREETSDPEILTREETGNADSDSRENREESEEEPASDQNQSSSEVPKVKPRLAEPQSAPSSTAEASLPGGDNSQSKETAGAEEREKEGVSDSGSSDENKDTWDMLSDANHDSCS